MTRTTESETIYESPDGKYRAEFKRDGRGIFFARSIGFQDFESAKTVVDMIEDLCRKEGKKILVCLDITRLEGADPRNRNYMKDSITGEDSPMRKIAVVGGNFLVRNLYNLFSKVSASPMKLFKSKDDAVKWLVGEE